VVALPAPTVAGFFARITSHLKVSASGQSQNKAIMSGRKVRANSIFPIEGDLGAFSGVHVIKIKQNDIRGKKPRIAGIRRPRIETGIVRSPLKSVGAHAAFGENRFLSAVGKIVQNGNRRNLLIELVAKALAMNCSYIFSVLGNGPALNAICVGGKP